MLLRITRNTRTLYFYRPWTLALPAAPPAFTGRFDAKERESRTHPLPSSGRSSQVIALPSLDLLKFFTGNRELAGRTRQAAARRYERHNVPLVHHRNRWI
ncbi:hypothetical protein [Roseiconus lacunae]|uniref:hypothetical protein n=1 Tax=Roseiconus lacunae TaxID=2605694 RepID=UPI001E353CEE|nr:hypothetical protein [Roseiconus lacunae]